MIEWLFFFPAQPPLSIVMFLIMIGIWGGVQWRMVGSTATSQTKLWSAIYMGSLVPTAFAPAFFSWGGFALMLALAWYVTGFERKKGNS